MDAAALGRPLQVGAVTALNVGLALAVGATALLDRSRQDCMRLLQGGLALAFVGALALLWWQAAAMGDVPLDQAGGQILPVLRQSHFGHVWLVGVAALLVTVLLKRAAGSGPAAKQQLALAVPLAIFITARASMSHLSADGPLWLAIMDGIHLAATAAWTGIVFCGVVLLRPRALQRPQQLTALVDRLSTVATWALGAVAATGATMAYRRLDGTVPVNLGSEYLRWLAIKLFLVAAAAGLGAFNRFAVMPSFMPEGREGQPGRGAYGFARILMVEALVLLGVLVLAALLATSAPPTGA